MRCSVPALLFLAAAPLAAEIPIRVGLDVQAQEWTVSLEGGGELRSREGQRLRALRPGEKLRIWWDAKGEVGASTECRVQVGPPLALLEADALLARLRGLGEAADRVRVADGDTWRVLSGHFARAEEAEPLLQKLQERGFEELWVATEAREVPARPGRALYGVTACYERFPLPARGVVLVPREGLTTVHGKGRYRGRVEIFPNTQGRLSVVNEVELETYLRGVVPKEMGAWEYPALEALKAQAVAARTYAVANRGKRAKDGFDLLDTVADQVYGGRDGEQSLTDRAVEETRGLVATYGGRPIQALFMANSGGHTVDNVHVFGGGATPYLKAASNYAERPTTLPFQGRLAPAGDQGWMSLELLRLAAVEAIPETWLDGARLARPLSGEELREPVARLTRRLALPVPPPPPEGGAPLLLWMARALGFGEVPEGQERDQDARYFLGDTPLEGSDLRLAGFLVRRGHTVPALWTGRPTLGQGLALLARLWGELEPLPLTEGTLLRDGQVRVKGGGPSPLALAPTVLLAEEAPGGSLRLVGSSRVQVGDRLRWLPAEGGSRVLVRRLDPDGASLDRYNPTAHWRAELKEADLLARLKERLPGFRGLKDLSFRYNQEGRVLELVLRDGAGRSRRFTGMRIRSLLGLKDNVFRMVQVGCAPERRWIAFGRGWGHGVGMDQTGAYGYALEGWSFDRILQHYYQGITLTKVE